MSALHSQFSEDQFQRNLASNRWTILLCLVIISLYYFIDPHTLPREAARDIAWWRVLLFVPALIACLSMTYLDVSRRTFYLFSTVGLTTTGLLFLLSDNPYGNNQTLHVFISIAHTMAVLLAGIVTPIRYCLPAALIVYVATVADVALSDSIEHANSVIFVCGLSGITGIMVLWAIIREREAKQQWLIDQERAHSNEIQNSTSRYFFDSLSLQIKHNCDAIESSFEELKALKPNSTYLDRSMHSFDQSLQLIDKLISSVSWRDALSNKSSKSLSASRLVNELVDDYRSIYPQFTFFLTEEVNFRIIGDSVLLARAISNLMDNAVRLHSPGTIIEIAIRNPRQISIRNSGPPIPDNLENMFQFGAGGSSANRGLFGLGLFLANQICRNHSAQLSAYQSGSKATFIIRFGE